MHVLRTIVKESKLIILKKIEIKNKCTRFEIEAAYTIIGII